MRKAIGYVRVSTEAQADDEKYGVRVQKKAINDYAKANGYEIVEWKVDKMSGAKDDRPALNEILYGDIFNPPIESVIAFKSDRIARDTKLYFYYLYVLDKKGIKLISTQENFEEGDEFANIYRSLMLFVAEQERKNIALRTGAGRTQKANCGGYAGGKLPYGYVSKNKVLTINEDERKIVEYVFQELDKKRSMLSISDSLNEMGYRTRKGTYFHNTSVRSIANNKRFYQGYYRYGKMEKWVKGVHEPILPDEEV